MNLPKDPVMLLSVINTALRDHYSSLEELAEDQELSSTELCQKLSVIDYFYDSTCNQFK